MIYGTMTSSWYYDVDFSRRVIALWRHHGVCRLLDELSYYDVIMVLWCRLLDELSHDDVIMVLWCRLLKILYWTIMTYWYPNVDFPKWFITRWRHLDIWMLTYRDDSRTMAISSLGYRCLEMIYFLTISRNDVNFPKSFIVQWRHP